MRFTVNRVGLGPKKEDRRYEPWNNIDRPIDTCADWSIANLGIQQWLGIWTGRNRRTPARHHYYPRIVRAAVSAPSSQQEGKVNT